MTMFKLMKLPITRRWLWGLFLLVGLTACVDAFTPTLTLNTDLLVVDGTITDQAGPQGITLSRSRTKADSVTNTPVRGAVVQLVVNTGSVFSFSETEPGRYQLPDGFRGKVGDSYQLRFTTAEGTRYESGVETMLAVPPIGRAYDRYNPNGPSQFADGLPTPSSDVYVDFQDPANARNFYFWRSRLYERQEWCASCQQGKYYIADTDPNLPAAGPIIVIGCVPDPTLGTFNFFDYTCREECYDIFYSRTINIFADAYSNGQLQTGRLVAQVPVYQRDPALLVIEQLSLTAGAYRYYKLFQDQAQNTGTLADTPPAPISGNVHNLSNSNENVVGYFTVSSLTENRYWLDRKNVTSGTFRGLFYAQNHRLPNVEPGRDPPPGMPPGFGFKVPSAICIPSRTRTNVQPVGWR